MNEKIKPRNQCTERARFFRSVALILVLGSLIQLFLCYRSWIDEDQIILLDLGLEFSEMGKLNPTAKSMSGDGRIPGCLLQLLIGIPLKIWPDYRAPMLSIGIFHLLAGLLASFVMYRAVGSKIALLYLIIYWLSPWRLFYSGFLWEPSFVFLPAALHLWSCWRLRDHPLLFPSILLFATLILTFQLHGSFMFLVVLTALLYFRKVVRIQWVGATLGGILGLLPLVPSISAFLNGTLPPVIPTGGEPVLSLLRLHHMLRGIIYWFRYGSLAIGRQLINVVFMKKEWASGHPERIILRIGVIGLYVLTIVSVLIALIAFWWYFNRKNQNNKLTRERKWLCAFVFNSFIAVIIVSILSPVAIQGWHLVIALHAATIPVTFWVAEQWPSRKKWLQRAVILFLILRIPEIIVIGFGHSNYIKKPLYDPGSVKIPERVRKVIPEHFFIPSRH